MDIQQMTLWASILGIVVGGVILWIAPEWRGVGAMIAWTSFVGALFYALVLWCGLPGHGLSQIRALIWALSWTTFGIGLISNKLRGRE